MKLLTSKLFNLKQITSRSVGGLQDQRRKGYYSNMYLWGFYIDRFGRLKDIYVTEYKKYD